MAADRIPEGFQQTEVGVIPGDWRIDSIRDLGLVKRGAGSQYITYVKIGGIRLIRINDFFEDNPVYIKPTKEILRFLIEEQDLLFAGTGASAGASFMPKPSWIGLPHSYNAPKIRLQDSELKKYVLYSLQSDYVKKQQEAWFVGAAQPFLDTAAISSFKIALPPTKKEQTAIAAALSDMDALIEGLERLIGKKRAVKQGAMQELLTGKRRLAGFGGGKGMRRTEVGVVPEDWSLERIGEHFHFKNGLNKEKRFFGYGTPIVNYMDVFQNTSLTAGKINGQVFLSREERNRYRVRKGDVFFTRTSETLEEIGMSAVCTEELEDTVFSGFVLRARPVTSFFDIEFCRYCFSPRLVREQIEKTASITTRALTNGRLLSDVIIPLPPTLAEQRAIARALSDLDAEIGQLEAQLAKYRRVKEGMMQELLTGKKRLV